jgi:hypothetical protein
MYTVMTKNQHSSLKLVRSEPTERANSRSHNRHTRRQNLKGVLAVGATVLALAGGAKFAQYQDSPGPKAEDPALAHPGVDYKAYVIRPGDTLSEIVLLAYPNITLDSPQYDQKLQELADQLPQTDRYENDRIIAGRTLELDPDANLQHLESEDRSA